MRVQGQSAVVLHSRPWSESSRLVDLLSRDFGRIRGIAKGCRRLKSRTRAQLLPFRPIVIGWSGKGELPTITAAEASQRAPKINGRGTVGAWYMNELLLRFLARLDAHPALYDSYIDALNRLATSEPIDIVLRNFECRLLSEIGYGLSFEFEANSTRPIRLEREYWYVVDKGALGIDSDVRELPRDAIRVQGSTLKCLASNQLQTENHRSEARALIRAVLARRLDGKPLHSRQYLDQIRHFESHQRTNQS